MEHQYLIQIDGTTVLVTGGTNDELTNIVQSANSEYNWLKDKQRAKLFAAH